MKKLILISLFMLLSMAANAYDFEVDGILYDIINEDEVSVSRKAYAYAGDIVIPQIVNFEGKTYLVTEIGHQAFYKCSDLTSIEIPNTVKRIGYYSFRSCTKLTDLIIPNSVTYIDSYAFQACTSLKNAVIGNSVKHIGDRAFYGCTILSNITFGQSLESIGESAFHYTEWFDSQLDGLIYAGTVAYSYKGTMPPETTIALKDGTLGIAYYAFHNCTNLVGIIFPESLTTIQELAFSGCTYLRNVPLPNSIRVIGSRAFNLCRNIKYIHLPNSIDSIGGDIFSEIYLINTLYLSGQGEWKNHNLSCNLYNLIIDSHLSSIRGMNVTPYNIYCYSSIPPVCDENSFTAYNGYLHVPAASLAAYFTAPYWSNFTNIIGDAVEPIGITIRSDSIEMQLGEDPVQLTVTVSPNNATPDNIIWKSTNTAIATVNNGIVTAVGVGECEVIAEYLNLRATCHVTIKNTSITITLGQSEVQVLPNHIITLTPNASPIMPELSVSSNNPSVAAARIVNDKIQVVGINEGTTVITVGSVDENAIPATCVVTVYTELGDLNMDGFINISDVTSLIDYLLSDDDSQISRKNADVNGDNVINISDVTTLIDLLLTGNN